MKRKVRTRRRGGAKIGKGENATVYSKPDVEMESLIPEGRKWEDGYVMKVFESAWPANVEWKKTEILRGKEIQGIIYPEEEPCTLKDGRVALFSPFGGETILEFFFSNGPINTREELLGVSKTIVRNHDKIDAVIEALGRLMEQVSIMNDRGISHNDIHDGNIVYDGKDARLIDFGTLTFSKKEIDDETGQIQEIIDSLREKKEESQNPSEVEGGLRKRVASSRRRTRRRRSYRSR